MGEAHRVHKLGLAVAKRLAVIQAAEWRSREGEGREWQQQSGAASSARIDAAWRNMQVALGGDPRSSDWWSSHGGWSGGQGRWEATTTWRWVQDPERPNPWRGELH